MRSCRATRTDNVPITGNADLNIGLSETLRTNAIFQRLHVDCKVGPAGSTLDFP